MVATGNNNVAMGN